MPFDVPTLAGCHLAPTTREQHLILMFATCHRGDLARTQAEFTANLPAAITAARLAASGHASADLAARVGKTAGADTAIQAVSDLAALISAAGFQIHHPVAHARRDLTGLLYADGIHDSLYLSGGLTLLTAAAGPARPPQPMPVAAG
ncbi:hypothetical protein [Actinoplanes sp. NPDC026623]|uniref:hypothetical protein n=1 Tax=Actinoplanes sp. NPDC026623 TaxID=3155610 RepID=UPI0033D63517